MAVYTNFFGGAFFGGGFFGPGVDSSVQAGGDSTRLRRRRRRTKRNWRYWWEKDEPEEVLVLSPEEAILAPVTVEALWEEQAELNDYIVEMSVAKVSQRVMDKLAEVTQFTQARIDTENARQRRIKKKRMLLLGGG